MKKCHNCEILENTLRLLTDTALSDDKSERLAAVFAGKAVLRHVEKTPPRSSWWKFWR